MKRSPDPTWHRRPRRRRLARAPRGPLALPRHPSDLHDAGGRAAWAVCLSALLAVAGGCRGPEQPSVEVVRLNALDSPCAVRMGEVCETLLLYYAANGRLPATPADLAAARGPDAPPLVCPLSGKPYVYNPSGLAIPRLTGKLVLYDDQPSHSGMRLAILVGASTADAAPAARPVVLSEAEFAAARAPDDGPHRP